MKFSNCIPLFPFQATEIGNGARFKAVVFLQSVAHVAFVSVVLCFNHVFTAFLWYFWADDSNFVDDDRAYELKTTLSIKHRVAEIIWGGLLLLCLVITVKEHVDKAIDVTTSAVDDLSKRVSVSKDQKKLS